MSDVARYMVHPGAPASLETRDTRDTALYPGMKKRSSLGELRRLNRRLAEMQRMLWADGGHALLVVLQAMDTGGKDGTIRKVFSGVNPQGVDVHGFSVPTPQELAHDYLWRVHARTPAKGRIGIFNRSHYEDVLVVRVEGLVPEQRWRARYDQITAFEELLTAEGTSIVKIMLHISADEQRDRLSARLADPAKLFKFNPSDLETRAKWDEYMSAYAEALERTSTTDAPWYVVPADRKWYRNLVVSRILLEHLEKLDLAYPSPEFDPAEILIE